MEQEQKSRKQLIIVILLCLLLHMLFMGIFFFWQHSNDIHDLTLAQQYEKRIEEILEKQTKEPLTPEEEKELFEWVNGQEKGNASVLFDDNILDEQGLPEGSEQGIAIEKPTEEAEEKIEPISPASQPQEEPKDIQESRAQPEQVEPIEIKPQDTTVVVPPSSDAHIQQPNAIEKKTARHEKKISQPQISKPSITLADITKGLVQKMNHSSDHLVNAINGKEGKVTEEQLRYERYFKKISYHFSNSDRIHRSNHIDALMKARDQIRNSMNILIALNRDGSLLDIQLTRSCGSKVIDEYYMFVFKDASSAFPNVPQFLPAPLKFGYTIGLEHHIQQSSSPIRFTLN